MPARPGAGRKRKYTAQQVQDICDNYFTGTPPPWTIYDLCRDLKIDRSTIWLWGKPDHDYSKIIRDAVGRIGAQHERALLNSKNPRGSEFWLKCSGWNDGSKGTQTVEAKGDGNLKITITSTCQGDGGTAIDV